MNGGHRFITRLGAVVTVAALLSGCAPLDRMTGGWREARRDSSEQAPDPASTPEAVVQAYAARAVGWRGVFAVHTWIAVKPRAAPSYTRYEVIGWGVDNGVPAVRVNRMGPDNYWFGARPERLVEHRGDGVDALIEKIEAAVRAYPYGTSYRTWPGPNSNTFTAYVARAVPELGLELPPTAVGKDFLPNGALAARSPSGSGVQVSLLGVAGVLAAFDEGLEVNVLGLTFGLAVKRPGVKLPIVGRVP